MRGWCATLIGRRSCRLCSPGNLSTLLSSFKIRKSTTLEVKDFLLCWVVHGQVKLGAPDGGGRQSCYSCVPPSFLLELPGVVEGRQRSMPDTLA